MDPLSALLLAMLIAGHFTKNVTQDLVYKARGEDPPSYRREMERIKRRQNRRPVTDRREARRFWANAWHDAWETAAERRARAHTKRQQQRREQWQAEDFGEVYGRAEDEAHDLNEAWGADPQSDPQFDQRDQPEQVTCPHCLQLVLRAHLVRVGDVDVCPYCWLKTPHPADDTSSSPPDLETAPAPVPTPGLPAPDGSPAADAAPTDGEVTAEDDRADNGNADETDDPERAGSWPQWRSTPAGQPHSLDKARPPDADVIQLDFRQRNAAGNTTAKEITTMTVTGETTNLQAAIAYYDAMADSCSQGVASAETSVAGMQGGGVSGPALSHAAGVQEHLGLAAAACQAVAAELRNHLAVKEAYDANQGAGDRPFVTQD